MKLFLLFLSLSLCNVHQFLHVTDLHFDPKYVEGSSIYLKCDDGVGTVGPFGDYDCDMPQVTIQSALDFLKTEPVAENTVLIYTGDSPPHLEQTHGSILRSVRLTTQWISDTFADTQVIVSPGNHDFLDFQITCSETALSEQSSLFVDAGWMTDEQSKTYNLGGYYSTRVDGIENLLIISVNTNLYYFHNKKNVGIVDPCGQMAWMKQQLKDAKSRKDHVIVIGHVAPGVDERHQRFEFHEEFNDAFLDVMNDPSILGSFWGHLHSDTFRVHPGQGTMWLSPAVDTWFNKGSSIPPNNAGVRIYEYDDMLEFPLVSYVQYWFNLTQANEERKIVWSPFYSSDDDLGMPDLSPESVSLWWESCKADEQCINDIVLRDSVGYAHECDDSCQKLIKCAIENIYVDSFNACIK